VGKTEVGVRNGFVLDQLLEVSLPLDRLWEGFLKPVRIGIEG
jgi:hypothetical protein